MYSRITCMMAISFFSPLSTNVSTSFLNCLRVSAIIAFNTIMALAQLADEPTARNSNLLPVNANERSCYGPYYPAAIRGCFYEYLFSTCFRLSHPFSEILFLLFHSVLWKDIHR